MVTNLIVIVYIGTIQDQVTTWKEIMSDEQDVPSHPTPLHDIQVIPSRLVAKAPQLLGNFTTNLAESWMHIHMKFDGGKVINVWILAT